MRSLEKGRPTNSLPTLPGDTQTKHSELFLESIEIGREMEERW